MAVFEALPDEPIEAKAAPESLSVPTGRLGNGEIKRAVVKVLAAAGGPIRAGRYLSGGRALARA
jgi:hypothetical protein